MFSHNDILTHRETYVEQPRQLYAIMISIIHDITRSCSDLWQFVTMIIDQVAIKVNMNAINILFFLICRTTLTRYIYIYKQKQNKKGHEESRMVLTQGF